MPISNERRSPFAHKHDYAQNQMGHARSRLLAGLFMLLAMAPSGFSAAIPSVFSTGVDDLGNALPIGTIDSHYTLSLSPLGPIPARVTTTHHDWVANTASSQWINATASGTDIAAPGTYQYIERRGL